VHRGGPGFPRAAGEDAGTPEYIGAVADEEPVRGVLAGLDDDPAKGLGAEPAAGLR
jgi:hypothetical protein